MTAVPLTALVDKIRKQAPGVFMLPHHTGYDARLGIHLEVDAGFLYLPDDNPEYVQAKLDALVERLRLRALRDLGLQPRIDAYEGEARVLRTANSTLADQLRAASLRNEQLQQLLDLKEQTDDHQEND